MAVLCPESHQIAPGMLVRVPRFIRTTGGAEIDEEAEMVVVGLYAGTGPVKEFAKLQLQDGKKPVLDLPSQVLIPVVPE